MLSWEFRDFFQKSYFSEHLHTATSNNLQQCFGAFVLHAFVHKQRLFSAQPQCCLTFYYICVYLCQGRFMFYECDLFFTIIFIFITINHIISLKQARLFFTKIQAQGVAYLLLNFLPISVWCFLQ